MTEFLKKITSKDIRNVLGVIVVIGCFILLYIMQIKEIPAANKDVVLTAVGFVFGGALAGVVGYYFGSSKNEADKAKKEGE
jgi:dolichol kinase